MDLKAYFKQGIEFDEYRSQIAIQSEGQHPEGSLEHYTQLNIARQERIYKKVVLTKEQQEELQKVDQRFNILIISEGWCGDASQILPIIDMMQSKLEDVKTRIVYRDQNPELMNNYLTNGAKSIPIIIGLDKKSGEEIFRWGPRPRRGMEMLARYKNNPQEYPKEQFYKELQQWYNKDKGQNIFDEIIKKFPAKPSN